MRQGAVDGVEPTIAAVFGAILERPAPRLIGAALARDPAIGALAVDRESLLEIARGQVAREILAAVGRQGGGRAELWNRLDGWCGPSRQTVLAQKRIDVRAPERDAVTAEQLMPVLAERRQGDE